MATLKQMAVRANEGHLRALEAFSEGRKLVAVGAPAWEVRGAMVVCDTLSRWGCLEGAVVTQTGQDLITLLRRRFGCEPEPILSRMDDPSEDP